MVTALAGLFLYPTYIRSSQSHVASRYDNRRKPVSTLLRSLLTFAQTPLGCKHAASRPTYIAYTAPATCSAMAIISKPSKSLACALTEYVTPMLST